MAELSKYQTKWLTEDAGVVIDLAKAEATAALREQKLQELIGDDLGASKKAIEDAQGLTLSKIEDKSGFFNSVFSSKEGQEATLKWKVSDSELNPKTWDTRADVEIDSRADLVGVEAPSEEARRAVIEAYERVLAIQVQMLNAYDNEGNRVFSDEDIRRELWTPLVRDNTIPENMVPSLFSEQSQAFKGAADMYQERIDDYSKNSTGHESAFEVLAITRETVSLAGSLVGGAITIGNAMSVADINQQIKSGKDGNTVLSNDQIASLKADKAEMQQQSAIATFAVTSLSGGLELLEAGAEEKIKGDDANWAAFADKTCRVFASVVAAGVGPLANEIIGVRDTTTTQGKQKVAVANAWKGGILGGIAAIRMGPSLLTALKAKKKGEDVKIVELLIGQIADVVDQSFAAAAAVETDSGDAANLKMLGAAIRSTLIATASAPEAIILARQGKFKEASLKLGSGVLLCSGSIASGFLADAMKKDVEAGEKGSSSFFEGQFMETTSDSSKGADEQQGVRESAEKYRAADADKFQKAVAAQLKKMEASILADFDENSQVTVDPAAVEAAKAMQKKISDQQSKMALEEIEKHFGDPDAIKDLFTDVDSKLGDYQKIYDEAAPDVLISEKGANDVQDALKYIDQAMARTAQLRARAEMINSLTSGGAAIIASAIPGAGAVAAAQKLAQDIYLVSKAVAMHNKWVESNELAFRAYSGYGAAIENTMENAKITLRHEQVKMVLDSLKLGAEVARAADPTGISTIVSTSISMGSALTEFGYSMHKRSEIATGWAAYKRAREDTENRKAGRTALRLNSTLAKCCIAYGAVVKKDPASQEAIRQSGLTPAMLADDRDVCKRLVAYLENEMTDDPVVMHVERQPKKWQPGRPELNVTKWFEIRSAAAVSAEPRLSSTSIRTPAIDASLTLLAGSAYWSGHPTYSAWRMAEAPEASDAERRKTRAIATIKELEKLVGLLDAYNPREAGDGKPHDDMSDIVDTMKALCTLNIRTAGSDASYKAPVLADDGDEIDWDNIPTRQRSATN